MTIQASSGDAWANKEMTAVVLALGQLHPRAAGRAISTWPWATPPSFNVASTAEAGTFYYEVVSRGRVVFTSSASRRHLLQGDAGHGAVGQAARLPDPAEQRGGGRFAALRRGGRVSAGGDRLLRRRARRSPATKCRSRCRPKGPAKVGLVAVDHSVFILAENRLNLRAGVRRARAPLHAAAGRAARGRVDGRQPTLIPGAEDTFNDAGLDRALQQEGARGQGDRVAADDVFAEDAGDGRRHAGAAPATTAARRDDHHGRGPGHVSRRRPGELAEVRAGAGSTSPRPGSGTRPSPTTRARPISSTRPPIPSPPGTCGRWPSRPRRAWASPRLR